MNTLLIYLFTRTVVFWPASVKIQHLLFCFHLQFQFPALICPSEVWEAEKKKTKFTLRGFYVSCIHLFWETHSGNFKRWILWEQPQSLSDMRRKRIDHKDNTQTAAGHSLTMERLFICCQIFHQQQQLRALPVNHQHNCVCMCVSLYQ